MRVSTCVLNWHENCELCVIDRVRGCKVSALTPRPRARPLFFVYPHLVILVNIMAFFCESDLYIYTMGCKYVVDVTELYKLNVLHG